MGDAATASDITVQAISVATKCLRLAENGVALIREEVFAGKKWDVLDNE